ncbi:MULTISPECIES: DUF4279 domain-containing protein [unclassified Roseofilum]|uniref:DUF4279 domain-containing protein n=1 Tax=unclassified Roseofilum TaxID=2620099 RepID=UPI001AFD2E74|nr:MULTISPECIES: DUF4279 domain-containing protein [unclassified Roseofilum]MBP0011374.1 DUF4279 domain-containing protein [Roseofilum sp. Belize Diploria]MBP0036004.1 DUF4279 domain-containing protein [Roseofilum sp. Belize BBD 4]
MKEQFFCSAEFCIFSKVITAQEMMKYFSIEPTRFYEKGTPLSQRNPKSKRRETAHWILESQLKEVEPLHLHIENLISLIENHADINGLKKIASDCKFEMYCGYFFEYPNSKDVILIDSYLLKRLTAIPIDISISLYPADPDEI